MKDSFCKSAFLLCDPWLWHEYNWSSWSIYNARFYEKVPRKPKGAGATWCLCCLCWQTEEDGQIKSFSRLNTSVMFTCTQQLIVLIIRGSFCSHQMAYVTVPLIFQFYWTYHLKTRRHIMCKPSSLCHCCISTQSVRANHRFESPFQTIVSLTVAVEVTFLCSDWLLAVCFAPADNTPWKWTIHGAIPD